MRYTLRIIALFLFVMIVQTFNASAQSAVTVVTLNDLRLRGGPGTQYNQITIIPAGRSLSANARSAKSDWARVEFNGQIGWLYVPQLRVKGDFASLPVADANTPANPSVATAPPAPPDGSIESLTPLATTDRVAYYKLVYWSDGLRITGYYAEPRGFGKFPAVIFNRSGNRNTGALTGMEIVPFAEGGFVVVASQLRGGAGSEGQEEFGGADVHDVTNLIPLLKSREKVDPNKIVMFGASRGGMMTYLALKQQALSGGNDIKAAATASGITDLFMWASERPDITSDLYMQLIGTSVRANPAPFQQRSAVYWPGMIRVPLLIQHGEADADVSVKQSQKLYRLLRTSNPAVKLITYPGGEHSLAAQNAGMPETFKWFSKYVAKPGESFDYWGNEGNMQRAWSILKWAR